MSKSKPTLEVTAIDKESGIVTIGEGAGEVKSIRQPAPKRSPRHAARHPRANRNEAEGVVTVCGARVPPAEIAGAGDSVASCCVKLLAIELAQADAADSKGVEQEAAEASQLRLDKSMPGRFLAHAHGEEES